MAKQFKQIIGSVSRPDLLLLEYDQAIKDGYVRVRERRAGTRIIIDLERDVVEEVVAKETVVEKTQEVLAEVDAPVETQKPTARKTTAKAK